MRNAPRALAWALWTPSRSSTSSPRRKRLSKSTGARGHLTVHNTASDTSGGPRTYHIEVDYQVWRVAAQLSND
jgi:hypothetical protein